MRNLNAFSVLRMAGIIFIAGIVLASNPWLFQRSGQHGGIVFVAGLGLASAWLVFWALLEEASGSTGRPWKMRRSLVDARQSRSVRRCAERLTARRRADRMEAVTILDALQDTTAVPALMRVLELYPDDVPFLLAVVGTLERLGDPRALPALRPLTFNHHYTLMQAAHKAIAAIEPRSVLLRPGTAPVPAADTLLRPAAAHVPAEAPHTLLRASQQAEGRDSHEPNFR